MIPVLQRRLITAWIGLLLCFACQVISAKPRIEVVALFKNAAVVQVGNQQKLLKTNQKPFHGVVLVNASAKYADLEVEGVVDRYFLSRAISGGYRDAESQSVSIARNGRGQYLTQGSINGRPVQLLVDTGATSVAINSGTASALGVNYRAGEKSRATTAGGVVDSYIVTLDAVKVGAIEVRNVRAAVIEGDFPEQVLLGMTFLSQVKMSEEAGVMYLQQTY